MVSITFSVPDEVKEDMNSLPWVNWSELARHKIIEELEKAKKLELLLKIVSKSKFTAEDAELLSAKVKASMHNRLKDKGLV